ncbi:ArsR/SmtB family transcription factor [Streptacidiphilus monticola]|uniref:ArsR/SmtB family transcription factor n=1 Tax=Streptacidiphilus monticola TaxID=2161674 RepID=A0ABW1G994_9ACTN
MAETDVFHALANPVRRRLLESLRQGPRAAGELAADFELSRPAVSEHLAVLRNARLVREEPRGRHRYYHLEPAPLAEVSDWLHPFERYWRARLRDLGALLNEEHPAP